MSGNGVLDLISKALDLTSTDEDFDKILSSQSEASRDTEHVKNIRPLDRGHPTVANDDAHVFSSSVFCNQDEYPVEDTECSSDEEDDRALVDLTMQRSGGQQDNDSVSVQWKFSRPSHQSIDVEETVLHPNSKRNERSSLEFERVPPSIMNDVAQRSTSEFSCADPWYPEDATEAHKDRTLDANSTNQICATKKIFESTADLVSKPPSPVSGESKTVEDAAATRSLCASSLSSPSTERSVPTNMPDDNVVIEHTTKEDADSSTAHDDNGTDERLIRSMVTFYQTHNPSRANRAAALKILERYKFRESLLHEKLTKKYQSAPGELLTCRRSNVLLPDDSRFQSESDPFVFLRIGPHDDDASVRNIKIRLFASVVPRTCENFRALCTGELGGVLAFEGSLIHRVIPNRLIQGGDFEKGDGTGGRSIYCGDSAPELFYKFSDENFTIKHDRPGRLSMANSGPNSNSSQFFITLEPFPYLDGKHVCFGQVESGIDYVRKLSTARTVQGSQRPVRPPTILRCGMLEENTNVSTRCDVAESKKNMKDKTKGDAMLLKVTAPASREETSRLSANDTHTDTQEHTILLKLVRAKSKKCKMRSCMVCNTRNATFAQLCDGCGSSLSVAARAIPDCERKWACGACNVSNHPKRRTCFACGLVRGAIRTSYMICA